MNREFLEIIISNKKEELIKTMETLLERYGFKFIGEKKNFGEKDFEYKHPKAQLLSFLIGAPRNNNIYLELRSDIDFSGISSTLYSARKWGENPEKLLEDIVQRFMYSCIPGFEGVIGQTPVKGRKFLKQLAPIFPKIAKSVFEDVGFNPLARKNSKDASNFEYGLEFDDSIDDDLDTNFGINQKYAKLFSSIMEPLREELLSLGYEPTEFNDKYALDDSWHWRISIPFSSKFGEELNFQPTKTGKISVSGDDIYKRGKSFTTDTPVQKILDTIKGEE